MNDYFVGRSVDSSHHHDLFVTLIKVVLIYANGIRPDLFVALVQKLGKR